MEETHTSNEHMNNVLTREGWEAIVKKCSEMNNHFRVLTKVLKSVDRISKFSDLLRASRDPSQD